MKSLLAIVFAAYVANASGAGCAELWTGKRFTGQHNICCSQCGECCKFSEPYISRLLSSKSGGTAQLSTFYQSANCRSGEGVTVDRDGWRDMSKLPAYRSVLTACVP